MVPVKMQVVNQPHAFNSAGSYLVELEVVNCPENEPQWQSIAPQGGMRLVGVTKAIADTFTVGSQYWMEFVLVSVPAS